MSKQTFASHHASHAAAVQLATTKLRDTDRVVLDLNRSRHEQMPVTHGEIVHFDPPIINNPFRHMQTNWID